MTVASNPAAVRDLAVRVGVGMNESGDSVASISTTVTQVCRAQGLHDADALVLPTAVLVKSGHDSQTGVQLGTSVVGSYRLDQVSALYRLTKKLTAGPVDIASANAQLDSIDSLKPTFSWPWRILGHGLLTAGLALLLQPTLQTLAVTFVLGLVIGALKLVRLPTVQLVFPVLVAFGVTVMVLIASRDLGLQDPIRILVPPLVTYLPGAALTIGTIELTSNQMVAGASRLVSGVVTLLLLAFGVLAGAAVVGVPLSSLQDDPTSAFGLWASWVGIAVFAVGMMLTYCVPPSVFPWMFAVLVTAAIGQAIGTAIVGAQLSGFFGALLMTPLVLWFDLLPKGPTKLVTFLPAFWMLVPGSSGLIAVVGAASSGDEGPGALESVGLTVASIALGVLVGSAIFNSLTRASGFRQPL
jgi:uncharacterized membrane protein YjjP (DUF1212 family)